MSINNKTPVAVESAAAGGQELSVVLKTATYGNTGLHQSQQR